MSNIYLASSHHRERLSTRIIVGMNCSNNRAIPVAHSVWNVPVMWHLPITGHHVPIVSSTATTVGNVTINEISMPQWRRTPIGSSPIWTISCHVHNVRFGERRTNWSRSLSVQRRKQVGLDIGWEGAMSCCILVGMRWLLLIDETRVGVGCNGKLLQLVLAKVVSRKGMALMICEVIGILMLVLEGEWGQQGLWLMYKYLQRNPY